MDTTRSHALTHLLADLAREQHGVLTRGQFLARDVPSSVLDQWLRSGRLELMHPGVYRVAGAPSTWPQRLLAACLAAGDGAVVSHRAAAAAWDLDGPFGGRVEISVPRAVQARPKAATVHRSGDLCPEYVTRRIGVPVTKPARTLVDLGAVTPRWDVDRAVDDALARRLVTHDGLLVALGALAGRGRRGAGVLRASLAERTGPPESVLEAEMERLIVRHALGEPERQYDIREGGRWVARTDFGYVPERLAVETDGVLTRVGRSALDDDTRRQNRIMAAGWVVLRFTWAQVVGTPEQVARDVRRMLDRRRHELGLAAAS